MALRKGFRSASSIASAILNDGIVMPITIKSPIHYSAAIPVLMNNELQNELL
jgi:hypothetical protein